MKNPSVEITILDTTLRDGAQSLPQEHQFGANKKADIADKIARLGAGVIEAGFPATPSDAAEVLQVAQTVGQNEYETQVWENGKAMNIQHEAAVIMGLSRATFSDIETTWEAVRAAKRSRIHTFISTDAAHMAAKFPGKSPEDVLAMGSAAVAYARKLIHGHVGATVEFSAEAATTTEIGYLERVIKEVIYQGADIVNVPDTVGQRDPFWMYDFYTKVIGWVMRANTDVIISAHNHNDLGLAVANTNMLIKAAIDYAATYGQKVCVQLETSICGLGERAGNADIFPIVAGLFKFSPETDIPVRWQFNPKNSVALSQEVMGDAGFEVHRQSPVVGADINVHRSGIHSDGVIKGGHRIYTPYDPIFWGHGVSARHEDGKYQGKGGRGAIKQI